MDEHLFIGRREQLGLLDEIFRSAARGSGVFVLLAGEAGLGKTDLVGAARSRAQEDRLLAKARFVIGRCYEDISEQNAYEPLLEVLNELAIVEGQGRRLAPLIIKILKESGPDWLAMIPGVGPAITAGVKTATIAGQWFFDSSANLPYQAQGLVNQYVNTLLKIAARYQPLVLVIEDAHWIDQSSVLLLERLVRRMASAPLVVLLTYRPSFLGEQHPLRKLQREASAAVSSHTLTLPGLTEGELQEYILARFGRPLSPHLASWLNHLCFGNPLFVTQYLSLLESLGILRQEAGQFILDAKLEYSAGEWQRSLNLPIPTDVQDVLEERIELLIEADRQMLQKAAIQGENFLSTVLSEVLNVDELDLLSRLRAIVENQRLIRYGQAEPGDVAAGDSAELYSFEHVLLHRMFYNKLSPRERVLYHQRIAAILERFLREAASAPPRKLLIEIARHHELGNQPEQAARYSFQAARSSYDGGGFKETAFLCEGALQALRQSRVTGPDHDRLFCEVVLLLLLASEKNLVEKGASAQFSAATLLAEALETVERIEDLSLLARVQHMQGILLVIKNSLPEAIQALQVALDTAHRSGDFQVAFVILSQLGMLVKAQEFSRGQALVLEALEQYRQRLAPTPGQPQPVELSRYYYRLLSYLGVGELDHGNFDEAERLLLDSVDGLKSQGFLDDLIQARNYLAQVYIQTGQFEAAEQELLESIRFLKDDPEPHPWRAYNIALLGKLYIEWDRVEQAAPFILDAWRETQAAWQVDVARFVSTYHAELHLHPGYQGCDLPAARRLLQAAIAEADRSGFQDMGIQDRALLALLELRSGDFDRANTISQEAVTGMEQHGIWLPALRPEEVYYVRALVLERAGHPGQARQCLEQALRYIQEKASRIGDESRRRVFMERVLLNQAILTAME